eukprot:3680163-Prymnesium_polylepis.2
MEENCTDSFHEALQAKHIAAPTDAGLSYSPPPPPKGKESRSACEGHTPWIHSYAPTITLNTGGSYNGTASRTPFVNSAALHHGQWTISFVVKSKELMGGGNPQNMWERDFIVDGSRSWGNIESVVGIGKGHNCGYH